MTDIAILGIDLAKNVFQLHGVNGAGRCVQKRRVMRDQLMEVIGDTSPCLIGVEACTGAFYWQRRFEAHGHTVKIMPPQYVRPFGQGQKNDRNDAEAICTAYSNPTCALYRESPLFNRTFKQFTVVGKGWSITELP